MCRGYVGGFRINKRTRARPSPTHAHMGVSSSKVCLGPYTEILCLNLSRALGPHVECVMSKDKVGIILECSCSDSGSRERSRHVHAMLRLCQGFFEFRVHLRELLPRRMLQLGG